jgi:small multidrug resistance pump
MRVRRFDSRTGRLHYGSENRAAGGRAAAAILDKRVAGGCVSWIYLVIAIVAEVGGTTSMKLSNGFTHWLPTVTMVLFYLVTFGFMTLAVKKLEISVAYAIWSGLGTVLIVGVGVLWFSESLTVVRIICLALIIGGVVGLQLTGMTH